MQYVPAVPMPSLSKPRLLSALVLLSACHREPERAPSTASDVGQQPTPAARARSAAEQIAEARCQLEQQCGNIGPDETFASEHDCLSRIQNDWREELSSRECVRGLEQRELEECLTELRAESCDNPLDTLSRISQCTRGQICGG